MKKFITTILLLISLITYSIARNDTVTVNPATGTYSPAYSNTQAAWFPIFILNIPEGYTDFELKGTITNFGDVNGDSSISAHNGTEVIYYYNSQYPYIGLIGRAPYQKFNEVYNQVYFTTSRAVRYTLDGNFIPVSSATWDPRKWIRQIPSFNILGNDLTYSLGNYTTIDGSINSVVVIIGYNRNSVPSDPDYEFNNTMKEQCKPTNVKLIWSVVYYNRDHAEHDDGTYNPGTGTGAKWKAIMPVGWTTSIEAKVGGTITRP